MEMQSNDIGLSALAKGAAAGAIGVSAMDYLVTWPMYKLEDQQAYEREKELQPDGKWAGHVVIKKTANALGIEPTEKTIFYMGKMNHYLIGIAPAVLYALYYRKVPLLKRSKGFLLGFGLWALMDEFVVPALGLSGPNTKYPWQAHLRGFLGHLMYGVAVHYALEFMDKRKEASDVRDPGGYD